MPTDPISAYIYFPTSFSAHVLWIVSRISGALNWFIALLVPVGCILVIGTLRVSAIEIHHGLLGLWVAKFVTYFSLAILKSECCRGYNALITESLKNRVGEKFELLRCCTDLIRPQDVCDPIFWRAVNGATISRPVQGTRIRSLTISLLKC